MKKNKIVRVACLQMNAGQDWRKNINRAEKLVKRASRMGARFVLLPENFALRASEAEANRFAFSFFSKTIFELKRIARENKVVLLAGSLLEPLKSLKKICFANTCFVFSPSGKQLVRYRKMHLFDVQLPGLSVTESKTILPGSKPGFFKAGGVKAGVGICYDLRFPEYFRRLSYQGVEILFLPANFTAQTGKTAWEVLLRARAVENQCFVVAAGQSGRHPGTGILSYGNSLILDPWGRVIKRASPDGEAVLVADLNLTGLRLFRRHFPVLTHRKIKP